MRVRWTARALRDLRSIADYISKDNPNAARRWTAQLKERAEKILPFPRAGRRIPEYDRDDIREVLLGNYRIMYRIYPDLVEILTVIEGHRLLRRLDPAPDDDED